MPHPPFINLDKGSRIPVYRQIYETIRRSIVVGEFFPGKPLPSSRFLAKQLGISRMTVINAYEQLTAEGYLESKKGAGTFVARRLPDEFLQTQRLKKEDTQPEPEVRKHEFSAYGKTIFGAASSVLRFNSPTPVAAFQHGLAALDEFPFGIWTKLAAQAYQRLSKENFGYGDPAGFYPLRAAIAAHLRSVRAVACEPEQVIITSGAQQAFDLIGRIFLAPGTGILIENPCYQGARQAFELFDARLVPVEVDDDGFNPANGLRADPPARLVYVTPSHQFPLGATMSLERRRALLEWANDQRAWIIEDDYDSEFRYEGRPLPSLQGLDENNRVLYVGTFSKTVFPALRLGCLVVPPDLIDIFTAVCALSGAAAPVIDQATLAEFITEGHFSRHLRRMRQLYAKRQEILVTELRARLSGLLEVQNTASGMHLVGWLPEALDDRRAAAEAARQGVSVAALSACYLTSPPRRGGLILGYSAVTEKQIKSGVRSLATALENLHGKDAYKA